MCFLGYGKEEKTAHQSIDEIEAASESCWRVFGVIGEWICDGWNRG